MTYSPASLIASLALRFPGARPFLEHRPWLENRPVPAADSASTSPEAPSASPPETPSASPLEPQLTHIARLEGIFAHQEAQYRRAEETCAMLRAQQEPVDIPQLMKADAFANRLLQQQTRLLRELRQARKELEALTKELDETARRVESLRNEAQRNDAQRNDAQCDDAQCDDAQCDESLRDESLRNDTLRNETQSAPDASGENEHIKFPAPPLTFAQSVVRKHCRQIDATPPKERAALVRRLIAEARAA